MRRANSGKQFFLDPDAKQFSGRRSALQHMIKNNCSSEDVKIMRKSMSEDGWKESVYLPKDWIFRETARNSTSGVVVLSAEGVIFESYLSVREFMESSEEFDENDILKIKKLSDEAGKQRRKGETGWKENEALPEGWKIMITRTKKHFLAPDGVRIAGRKAALQHMIREEFNSEDVKIMRKSMSEDGWRESLHLPKDWIYKDTAKNSTSGVVVLSDGGVIFESYLSVREFMESSENFDKNDVENIKKLSDEAARRRRKDDMGWKESKTLPEGWKIMITGTKKHFLTPDGVRIAGRRATLQHMIKRNFSKEDVKIMRKSMGEDGWKESVFLPKDWIYRDTASSSASGVLVLSAEGVIFDSYLNVREFMESSESFDDIDINNIKKLCDEAAKLRRKNGQDWVETDSLPLGWKMRAGKAGKKVFLAPSGEQFFGRKAALLHMFQQNFQPDEIKKMRESMREDGWQFSDFLPSDWIFRVTYTTGNSSVHLISHNGLAFESYSGAKEYMKQSKFYGPEDIAKVEKLSELNGIRRMQQLRQSMDKSENELTLQENEQEENVVEQRRRMSKLHDWINAEDLPEGWKTKATGKAFLSPEGKMLLGSLSILKYFSQKQNISQIKDFMKKSGWKMSKLLPKNWRYQKTKNNSISFLTPHGDVLRGSVQAKALIQAKDGSETRESRNFEIFLNIRMGEQRSTAYTWNGNDPTLPTGWKSRVTKGNSSKIFFISPENEQFVNRASILRRISEGGKYEAGDLAIVRKSLELDGWEDHPALPENWR